MSLDSQRQDELLDLIDKVCHAEIQPDEMERLNSMLLDDAEAQTFYLEQVDLINSLRWQNTADASYESVVARRSRAKERTTIWRKASVIAVAISVCVALFILFRGNDGEVGPGPVLTQTSGNVFVVGEDGTSVLATSGERIENAKLRTDDTSLAVVAFDDGPRLTLAAGAIVEFNQPKGNRITVEQGTIAALFDRGQSRRPYVIETDNALIEEEGTAAEFSLSATKAGTSLKVSDGQVKFTRSSDGTSIVVPEGKRVATGESSRLTLKETAPPPETWGEDFKDGLPDGWQQGEFVDDELPVGSHGAVAASLTDDQPPVFAITSPHAWMDGLFVVYEDSHLNMTVKMQDTRWINIFFITRTDDPKDPTTFLHNFSALQTGRIEPGVWTTVRIPLALFRRKTDAGFTDPPKFGELAFGISWSAPEPDRGLVIDQVWVSRGGPGEVSIQKAE